MGQAAATTTNQEAYGLPTPKKNGPYSPQTLRRKKRIFLKAFAQTLAITSAAEAAGVDRGAHYTWVQNDPIYAQAFADIEERKVEYLERQVYQRGSVGWDEPVFHQGEICGHIKRFSDACAIFMLKAARPEKYRERYQVDGPLGALLDGIRVEFVDASSVGPVVEHKQIEAVVVEEEAPEQESKIQRRGHE